MKANLYAITTSIIPCIWLKHRRICDGLPSKHWWPTSNIYLKKIILPELTLWFRRFESREWFFLLFRISQHLFYFNFKICTCCNYDKTHVVTGYMTVSNIWIIVIYIFLPLFKELTTCPSADKSTALPTAPSEPALNRIRFIVFVLGSYGILLQCLDLFRYLYWYHIVIFFFCQDWSKIKWSSNKHHY